MKRSCGSKPTASLGARGRAPRRVAHVLVAAALAGTLAAPRTALAAGGTSDPSPQQLWHSYPLDSAHKGRIRPPARAATHPRRAASSAAGSSSALSWLAWVGIAVGVLAAAGAAFALLRRSARATAGPASPSTLPASVALVAEAANGAAAAPRAGPARQTAETNGRMRDETVLKRKPPPSDRAVKTLKDKRPPSSAREGEVGVLKEKLSTRPPRQKERPQTASPAVARPRAPAPGTVCRIDWWRGYVKSTFDAKVRNPDGSETVLLSSPPFRWSKPAPPPKDLPHVVRAHAALVDELKAAGWVARGRGNQWYALELQRRQVSAGAERAT
jgi:hypothetical protein